MTPAERIAQLEAELARERASRERLERALEDSAAAVRAAADDRRTLESRRATDRERRRRADEEKRRRALGATTSRDVTTSDSRESHVSTPPSSPPFPSPFPPSPDPSSPYPLSFPPSSPSPSFPPPAVASAASGQGELLPSAPPTPPAKPEKKPRAKKPDGPTDPRHAPLSAALVALGWPHHGGRTAAAIRDLLAHADRLPTTAGDKAQAEIMRRAAIAKASDTFPRVRELDELALKWGHFADSGPSTRPKDVTRGVVRAEEMHHTGPGDLTI